MKIRGLSKLSNRQLRELIKAAEARAKTMLRSCPLCDIYSKCIRCPGGVIRGERFLNICRRYVYERNNGVGLAYAKQILRRCRREATIRKNREANHV